MQFIHSEQINLFIQKLSKFSREILSQTFQLKVRRKSFYFKGYYYPISIMCFEGKDAGFYDPRSYTIGINQQLFNYDEDILKKVLTHELLHYLCSLVHEKNYAQLLPHGKEFKQLGEYYNLDQDIILSSIQLDLQKNFQSEVKLKEKVKKLLNLSKSTNAHEAKIALLKANQIILQNQISFNDLENSDEKAYFSKVIYSSKKSNALIRSLSSILNLFMLKTILWHKKGSVDLLAFSSSEYLELADFLVETIINYIELGFKEKQKLYQIKGLKAKNQYIYGITEGFIKKQKQSEVSLQAEEKSLILSLRHEVERQFAQAYPQMSKSYSKSSYDPRSFSLGQADGKKLNINLPLKNQKPTNKLLTMLKGQ